MFLLYCMMKDDPPFACSAVGAGGAKVQDVAKNGVRYFYSEWNPSKTADAVKEDVLRFHNVVHSIFDHQTVIPFRFPTSVADEAGLAALIASTSSEYDTELVRLHNTVQMKVKISAPAADFPSTPAASGTEYLKQRQRAASPVSDTVKTIEAATAPLVIQTKKSHPANDVVLHLLLQRDQQEELKHRFSLLSGLPAAVTISGPWPPTEFVNCYPELPPPAPAAS